MRCIVVPEGATPAVQQSYAQILAVHAALLHTGKIVYFSGDEHDPGRHKLGQFDHARLFDCTTLAITSPTPSPTIKDLFCCGHAFLPDGRLLVAGGTQAWMIERVGGGDPHGHAGMGHFRGTAEAYVFEPDLTRWRDVDRMVPEPGKTTGGGRWYPTLVTLGSGHVVAVSGHPSEADTRHFNNTVEEYQASDGPGGWVDLGTLPPRLAGYPDLTFYPRAHLLPDGTLFFSSPINGQSLKLNPISMAWVPVSAGPGNDYDGIGTNSVLLPLLSEDTYRTRVLVCGRQEAKRIDLNATHPTWEPTQGRTLLVGGAPPVRTHANSVLLPTGDVVVCGGMRNPGDDPGSAVLPVEIYRPSTNNWVTMPAVANTQVPRNYHSVALLMPDGRVWMAGSNRRASWSYHEPAAHTDPNGNLVSLPTTAQEGTIDNRELRIELFEPWYVGRPDRPTFTTEKVGASVGTTFEIVTPQALTVSRVALLRAGSATHSFNPDQRYVGLPFTRSPGKLSVTVPDKENLLPPGYYLLFILDAIVDGVTGALLDVPSTGQFFRIDNTKQFKELKWEVEVKLELELPDPKIIAENDPFDWRHRIDPVVNPPYVLRLLAERLDNIERRLPAGRAFIKAEERPLLSPMRGAALEPAALQRTPPPTAQELAMREHHQHEMQPVLEHGQHPGGHDHGGAEPPAAPGGGHYHTAMQNRQTPEPAPRGRQSGGAGAKHKKRRR
jgi:hypothetical protein